MNIPICLTIAGSDPSGGAGIQADLKTFHQHQCYGMSVITLLTVQNTCTVNEVKLLDAEFVLKQLNIVLEDIPPVAAKTGALGSSEIIEAIAGRVAREPFPLIVDPVMISKHGLALIEDSAVESLISVLLSRAFLITPNIPEACRIAEMSQINDLEEMKTAARIIVKRGAANVLIKGGHLPGESVDLLFTNGEFCCFRSSRIDTKNTHGTGCVFSAAITALVGRGFALNEAVHRAKEFITRAIQENQGLGKGLGPTNLHVRAGI